MIKHRSRSFKFFVPIFLLLSIFINIGAGIVLVIILMITAIMIDAKLFIIIIEE